MNKFYFEMSSALKLYASPKIDFKFYTFCLDKNKLQPHIILF